MTTNQHLTFRLAERMLATGHPELSVDDLFEDELIGDFVKSIQIDSPYQQLLLEGVLTERVQEGELMVGFTVEGYFHHVLGEVIHHQTEGQGAAELLNLIESSSLNGVKEGVERCLIKDSEAGELDRLMELIDMGGMGMRIARFPLVAAFIHHDVRQVYDALMANPTREDWVILRQARSLLQANQKERPLQELDRIIKESNDLSETISAFISDVNDDNGEQLLELIAFHRDLNALDIAKLHFEEVIAIAEEKNLDNTLVRALEALGDSEYQRAGQDGYLASMDALQRALKLREKQGADSAILKNTYRLLGFAHLSLNLQVVEAARYFQLAGDMMKQEAPKSAELTDIQLYQGLATFWRGLRGTGRWGHADPSLIEDTAESLFDEAEQLFERAHDYHSVHQGKSHPQTLKAIHYLQENRYASGDYGKAIPWIEKYVAALPFKSKEHQDNFYRYCLIVALEEFAKQQWPLNPDGAMNSLDRALDVAAGYDQQNQISARLTNLKNQLGAGNWQEPIIREVGALTELSTFEGLEAKWEPWRSDLKGFQTNHWLMTPAGGWFFHNGEKTLAFWTAQTNRVQRYTPDRWPEKCGKFIWDEQTNTLYAWSSIRSSVFRLDDPEGAWTAASMGVHDVHANGSSFGFDPVQRRLFEFGGYGYFTKKNWLWVYDLEEGHWTEMQENRPGIAPYPRNGQWLPIEGGRKGLLISGIGSDTGIQREHKVRMGLPSATDVGYFTWLRDAHEFDFASMQWTPRLDANHPTLQHEGAMGWLEHHGVVVNWGGQIPAPRYGEEATECDSMSAWRPDKQDGFQLLSFSGDIPPPRGGRFVQLPDGQSLLLLHGDGMWKMTLN